MKRTAALPIYVATVCLSGAGVAAWMLAGSYSALTGVPWLLVVLLAAGLAAWELAPITMLREGREAATTALANTFALALLAVAPPALAFIALAVPSVVDNIKDRAPWHRTGFNVASYALLIAAARAAFCLVSGEGFFSSPAIGTEHVWAVLVMGVVYAVVNELLVQPAIALSGNEPILPTLRQAAADVWFDRIVEISCSLLALAATAVFGPIALVALLPSVFAVWRNTKYAAERAHEAWHDKNTGLPNVAKLAQTYVRRREEVAPGRQRLAMLLIKLDRLAGVQKVFGQEAVDILLAAAAHRIQSNIREGDLLAQQGNDFLLLAPLHSPQAGDDLEQLAARVLACLNKEPFFLEHVHVGVRATIGAAVTETALEEPGLLIMRAGLALDAAREQRPGTLRLYSPSDDEDEVVTRVQLQLLAEFDAAIEQRQLELHYQPKIRLADGAVCGVEALVRWRHPERGLLYPDTFIPLAEETGLIDDLTWQVLDLAVSQVKSWQQDNGWDVGVSVNFTAAQILREETVGRIMGALLFHDVPCHLFTVEITEGTLVADKDKALEVLHALRRGNVRISIDDYGTGHSSLAYLHQLHPQELKIDRCFVKDLATVKAGTAPAIIESTVAMAKGLSVEVVAEGAEDIATVGILSALGVDVVQGYHYSKPLPAADLTAWLQTQKVKQTNLPRQREPQHRSDAPRRAAAQEDTASAG